MAQVRVGKLETWCCNHCDWQLLITRPWDGRGGAKQQVASHVGSCKTARKNWWLEVRAKAQHGIYVKGWAPPRTVEANGERVPCLTYVVETHDTIV